jgi:hypothetical protein
VKKIDFGIYLQDGPNLGRTKISETGDPMGSLLVKLGSGAQPSPMEAWGQGHVAMEVWLNEQNKWVFLDGQFGAYLTKRDSNELLSYYEIFKEKSAGRWSNLKVHFVKPPKNLGQESEEYKKFLGQYFGHMSVSAGEDAPKIGLLLDSQEMPLTFQGTQSNDVVFTSDSSMVYPSMNRVSLTLHFIKEAPNFPKLIEKLKIKNDEDYIRNMHEFAAEPNFLVSLRTTEPLFDQFEYRLNSTGKWNKLDGPNFNWNANNKSNILEVRAINKLGRYGPTTFIELAYQ